MMPSFTEPQMGRTWLYSCFARWGEVGQATPIGQ